MHGQLRQLFYPEYRQDEKQQRILVVDDDPGILRIVSLVLEQQGYEVHTAISGEQAYQLACKVLLDLIILDINLPEGWSGFSTCKKFKSNIQLSDIPIIFLAASATQLQQSFDVGGADYLLKPFNNQELIVRTQFHLKMSRLIKEVQQSNRNLENKVQQGSLDLADSNNKLNQAMTESKSLTNRLKLEEGTDSLTNLPNGVSFEHHLQNYLDQRNSDSSEDALLFLDLVKFKVINLCFGWSAGDYVISSVSQLLQSQLGEAVLIGRLGGDQFAVFLEHTTVANAAVVARGLVDCISSFPFSYNTQQIQAEVCIGLCVVDNNDSSARKITSKAIHASIQAKKQGLGSVVNYHNLNAQQLANQSDSKLSSRLESALNLNEFALFYQKVCPLLTQSNQLPSVDILLRFKSEVTQQLRFGNVFIETSEQHPINKKIDLWVLQATLDWIQHNRHLHNQFSHVSIKLSAGTLADPMFLITLETILEEKSVTSSFLCFEISESDALLSIERTEVFLSNLKKLGCKTCLDDFGGHTSLVQYLNVLEIDYLKLDGAVFRGYSESPCNALLCETLTKLAELSDNTLIAKHIEHASVAQNLISLGIKHAQGTLFHEPEPISQLI